MCIQWCCKHCGDRGTKLTHRWARERCNEYFIARSFDETMTDCPKGPWELRRAFHRHPYRGAQRCDDCKKAGRKDSKLFQSARQKANVALGERPEYTGAIFLGELEIPDHFQGTTAAHLLEPGKVDAMKSNWEKFSLANEHLPSHELEREWTTRFAAFNVAGLDAGLRTRPLKLASTLGQRMSEEEDRNRGNTESVEEGFRCSCQQIQRQSKSTMYTRNGPSHGKHQQVQCNIGSEAKNNNCTTVEQEIPQSTNQHFPHNISSDTDKQKFPTVERAPSHNRHHQTYKTINLRTNGNNSTTAEGKELPRGPHSEAPDNSTATTCSSSSQSTRARPWDL